MKLYFGRLAALGILAAPAFAQYAGPAILSRGEAPSAMNAPEIDFRPYLTITGVYDTGLSGVSINAEGQLPYVASPGVEFAGGISGVHSWKHTKIGLDYHGDVIHYTTNSFFDSTDQTIMFSVTHQFTRRMSLVLNESAGMFSRDEGVLGLQEALPYDPSTAAIPTTDFFDNRTIYSSTQASLIYQKSSRLSISLGGNGDLTRQRSAALYGANGYGARGDLEYRLSRRTTIGALYTYTHFSYTHIFSGTDLNGVAGTYSVQLSRWWEFTGYGGFYRVESKLAENVPIDPVVAALLGVSQGISIAYTLRYTPNINARLSRTFHTGVAWASGGHVVTPGNGLFLTSVMTTISAGYTYTGLRRWSFNLGASYDNADALGTATGATGNYRDYLGRLAISRDITRAVRVVAGFEAHKYDSSDFHLYNRLVYDARVGLSFSPGTVPLRMW